VASIPATVTAPASARPAADSEARLAQALLLAACAFLVAFLLAPLLLILIKSVQDKGGAFVGLAQFREYLQSPALIDSAINTVLVALAVTLITVPLAFAFAYALTRSAMPWKGLFRLIALTPILAPSMLAAISFIQWFGNQGALKGLMFGHSVYGPIGIIISAVYAIFPHALMIVLTALLLADGRLYEAATSLRTSTLRKFFTITLPAARYGLVSAAMVVFSYTVSDFGIPKVIGGNFHVLAIDIYQQVIGQQNFNRGAVVGLVLLLPVVLAFVVDWRMQGQQHAHFSSRAVPYVPKRAPAFDTAMFAYCTVVCIMMRLLAAIPMAVPGMVLGLGYIFFFNAPANPLHFLYGTMTILVLSTIIHYYTSSHLTAVTALKSLDNEFEAVSASLKVPFYKTFARVTVPVCLPAILDIARYLFINSMVTLSAVIFLYSPDTKLASVAIVNLDEAGEIGPAAAMATLIVATSTLVCLAYALLTRVLLRRTQAWRG